MVQVSKNNKEAPALSRAAESQISDRATATPPSSDTREKIGKQVGKQAGKLSFDTSKLDQEEIVKQILGNVGHSAANRALTEFSKNVGACQFIEALKQPDGLLTQSGDSLSFRFHKWDYQGMQIAVTKLILAGDIDRRLITLDPNVTRDQALGEHYYQKTAQSFVGILAATDKFRAEEAKKKAEIMATYGANQASKTADVRPQIKDSSILKAQEIIAAHKKNPDKGLGELGRNLVREKSSDVVELVKGAITNELNAKNMKSEDRAAREAALRNIRIAEQEARIIKAAQSGGELSTLVQELDHLGGAKAVASFMYRQQRDGNAALVAEVAEAVQTAPNGLSGRLNDVVRKSSLTGEQQKIVQAMTGNLTKVA
jgi:hypothetical protein